MPADSEGTWQIGIVDIATLAASDFGQWTPTHGTPDEDLWASADAAIEPVTFRALKRAATQLAAVASGERPCTLGILVDGSQRLLANGGAAEFTVDTVRVRRPIQVRCNYDGGATLTKLYLSLASGEGSSATNAYGQGIVVSGVATRLKTIVFQCDLDLGSTVIEVEVAGVAVDSATVAVGAGATVVDFLTEAGDHTLAANGVVAVSIDPTNAHDIVRVLLEFEEYPV